jgi:dihydroorotate dehydrogenase electron transfer subunit
MMDRKVIVKQVQNLGAGNYLLTLDSPEQARQARPGQFLMVKCAEDVDESPLLRRAFSIFAIDTDPRTQRPSGIKILVKDIGLGTHKLANVRPGQELFALGPQGRPFEPDKDLNSEIRYACLVAGGVGIAALYLLARELIALGNTPVLFYGARATEELVLRDYFERLGVRTFYATENGSKGTRGLVTAPLNLFLRKHHKQGIHMYACGPWGMLRAADRLARHYAVPCVVSLEARMGCSVGACMGCVIRTKGDRSSARYLRVCTEGPVMSSRLIDWASSPM